MTTTRSRFFVIPMLLLATGCMTWSRPVPPGAALSHVSDRPSQIARTDHSTIVVKNASVQGDTLIGVTADDSNARVAIPISEIQTVAQRKIDGPRTLALTGGIILSALGTLVIAVVIVATHAKNPLL